MLPVVKLAAVRLVFVRRRHRPCSLGPRRSDSQPLGLASWFLVSGLHVSANMFSISCQSQTSGGSSTAVREGDEDGWRILMRRLFSATTASATCVRTTLLWLLSSSEGGFFLFSDEISDTSVWSSAVSVSSDGFMSVCGPLFCSQSQCSLKQNPVAFPNLCVFLLLLLLLLSVHFRGHLTQMSVECCLSLWSCVIDSSSSPVISGTFSNSSKCFYLLGGMKRPDVDVGRVYQKPL